MSTKAPDKVDGAIAAEAAPEQRVQMQVVLGTSRRTIVVNVPADLTPIEMLDFIGWCGSKALPDLAQIAHPGRSRLLLPT